jgi:hypothetical protein
MPSGTIKGYLSSQQNGLNGSTYVVDMSAGTTGTALATDDFVLLFAYSAGSVATSVAPSAPTGFTTLVAWQALGTSTTTSYALYAKKRASGDTNYTVSQTNTGAANTTKYRAAWIDGSNAKDVPDWIVGTIGTRAGSGGTVNTIAPSVTTLVDNSMVFAFGEERTTASEVDANLTVSGTGWTKRLALLPGTAAESTITIASKGLVTAGASGDVTFTTINTQSANGAAVQFVIPPIPDAVSPGFPGYMYDGAALVAGEWYVAAAGDTQVPADWAGMIHPGYEDITAMLAEDFFYCGHRGGSANWPEMSLQAYTQAALRGYGALEVSLARTSDGVWFGLHDSSLDRTSLGTGGSTLVASAMTWAQVQAYDILPATIAPVNSTHQPYMELDEILDTYLKTHILFIDPKAALAHRAELIGILQNRPQWQDRIVAKYVPGNSNNSWLADARAAGFVTNAMFYDTDTFATYHGQGDILGMEYNASEAVWDSITALGKPVMCHVCPTRMSVTIGKDLGAKGAMVSGVAQVPLSSVMARSDLSGGSYEPDPVVTTGIVGGLGARGRLSVVNGDVTHSTAGQVFNDVWFKGKVLRRANNIIYNRCWFSDTANCDDTTASYSGTQYNDCTFEAETCTNNDHGYAIVGYGFTATRCRVRRFKDGIRIRSIGGDVATITYVQQCHIDELLWWSDDPEQVDGTHNDGIQVEGGTDFIIRWNSVHAYSSQVAGFGDQPTGAHTDQPQSSQCIIYTNNVSNKMVGQVYENWLYGGEITVNVSKDTLTGVNIGSFDDNIFAPDSWFSGQAFKYQAGMTYTQNNNRYEDGTLITPISG